MKVIEVDYSPAESFQKLYTSILNRSLQEDLATEGITVSVSGNFNEHMTAGISPRLIRNNARRFLRSALTGAQDGDFLEIFGADLLVHVKTTDLECGNRIGYLAKITARK